MKKFKILALVMTCAILLSSFAIIPVSATNQGVSIDGIADDGIWANSVATYKLNYNVKDGIYYSGHQSNTQSDAVEVAEADQSTVKIAYDAEYLYVYHESTQANYLNPTVTDKKSGFYFALASNNRNMDSSDSTEDGLAIKYYVRTHSGVLDKLTPTTNTVGTTTTATYVWDGSSDSISSGSTLLDFIQYRHHATASNFNYASNSVYYKNTIVALTITSENETIVKKSIEMKIPLADAYKAALQTAGGADLQVQFFERTRQYNGGSDSGDSGCVMMYDSDSSGAIEIATDKRSFDFTTNFTKAGVDLNLPSLNLLADGSKTAPVLVGFQSKDNGNDTYDVRFVAVVDKYDGFTFENSKLGFVFNNGTVDDTRYCTKVYETLNAGEGTIKATDFGGKYFFCFTIKGMDVNATYNLGVKCFTKATAEAAAEYCSNPVDVKITYEAGKAVFTY